MHPFYTFMREYDTITWPDIALVRENGPDKANVIGASLLLVNVANSEKVEGYVCEQCVDRYMYVNS